MPLDLIQTSTLADIIPTERSTEQASSDLEAIEDTLTLEDADLNDDLPEDSALSEDGDGDPDTMTEEEGMIRVIEGFTSVFPNPTMEQAEHLAQAFMLEGDAAQAFVDALLAEAYGPDDDDMVELGASTPQDNDELVDMIDDEDDSEDGGDEAGDDSSEEDAALIRALAGPDGTDQDELTEALNNDGVEDHGEAPDDENVQNDGEPDLPSKRQEVPEGIDDGAPVNDNGHSSRNIPGAEDGTST